MKKKISQKGEKKWLNLNIYKKKWQTNPSDLL